MFLYAGSYTYFRSLKEYPIFDGLAGDAVLGGSFLDEDSIYDESKYERYCESHMKLSGINNKLVLNYKDNDIKFILFLVD